MSSKRKIESTLENVFENETGNDCFSEINLDSDSDDDADETENITNKTNIDSDSDNNVDENEDYANSETDEDEREDTDNDNTEDDSDEWEDIDEKNFKDDNNTKKEEDATDNNKQRSYRDNESENESGYAGSTREENVEDEYAEDSSDEEDLRNTVGNIPLNWYDEFEHIGYGLDGLKILKPKERDTLDKLLDKIENPDYNRMVFDKQTGQNVRLSDQDLDLVRRLLKAKVPNAQYNMYETFHDLYSHEVMEMPLSGRPEDKRSMLPVKHERQKVVRLAYLIKRGLYKRSQKPKKEEPKYFDLWKPRSDDDPPLWGVSNPIKAPRAPLPGHSDSYNPPPEYLISKHDAQTLKDKATAERKHFKRFWRKFGSVREIPFYPKTIKERYERLLDLYLATRKAYRKVTAEAKDFLPKLPDKKDLRPYPTMEGLVFRGHDSIIRTISLHPNGKYLASGSDDHTVRVWEVSTGRCLRKFEVEAAVKKVTWNPNPKLFLLGIAMGNTVVFLNPETYLTDKVVVQKTNSIFKETVDQGDYVAPERVLEAVKWQKPSEDQWHKGYRIVLEHFRDVKTIVWHKQGDFFASVVPEGDHRSVLIHQLSRWRSQLPFQRNKGRVQTVAFHPKQPILFVVTQTNIRVYNLKKQGMLKKIQANSRWISCISVHPSGEHFIIGGYDRRVNWFEMECTKRPHLMRFHGNSVRSIEFHRKYPMFASCSDDQKVIVTHGRVYDDWLKDPLIVPLKVLKGHAKFDDLYVLDVAWHPYEPYLFTAGADATIRLWH